MVASTTQPSTSTTQAIGISVASIASAMAAQVWLTLHQMKQNLWSPKDFPVSLYVNPTVGGGLDLTKAKEGITSLNLT